MNEKYLLSINHIKNSNHLNPDYYEGDVKIFINKLNSIVKLINDACCFVKINYFDNNNVESIKINDLEGEVDISIYFTTYNYFYSAVVKLVNMSCTYYHAFNQFDIFIKNLDKFLNLYIDYSKKINDAKKEFEEEFKKINY